MTRLCGWLSWTLDRLTLGVWIVAMLASIVAFAVVLALPGLR